MRRRIDPNCAACGGSGRNSRGNLCAPCQVNGEPVSPARPVQAQTNADGSIDVEGKPHYQCAGCEEWFPKGGTIVDNTKGLPQADGKRRCGPCHRTKYMGKIPHRDIKPDNIPVKKPKPKVDVALEGFL